jgi:hypothetical protein
MHERRDVVNFASVGADADTDVDVDALRLGGTGLLGAGRCCDRHGESLSLRELLLHARQLALDLGLARLQLPQRHACRAA